MVVVGFVLWGDGCLHSALHMWMMVGGGYSGDNISLFFSLDNGN